MRQTRLGDTDLELSVVGLGGYELGDAGLGGWALEGATPPSPETIDAVLRAALDSGHTWIDTAEEYHAGGNERAIGEAMRRTGTEELLVSTKLWPAPTGSGFHPDGVHRGIRDSLARLGRDHADMYLLHTWDDSVPVEDTWGAMHEVRDDGLARAIGVSNFDQTQIERALAVGPVHVLQTGLSMVDYLEDRDLIRWCESHGIAVQAYEPLGSSILTGAIDRQTDVDALWGGHLDEWALFDRLFKGDRFERSMKVVDGLRTLGEQWGAQIPQLAIAWVLAQPGVDVAIAGTGNPDHARSNAVGGELKLSDEQLGELEALVPLGPAFA
jgi:aryl-alcohol dehydrogenase-like predicted oxidoreductase